jgi:ESCRT-II complex subunit VPS25
MEWPWQYSFPPFYTLQPNEDTKKKQVDAWSDLIIKYCKEKRIYQLDLAEASNTELFNNKQIERKCSPELLNEIFEHLIKNNRAEWILTPNVSSKNLKNVSPNTSIRKCFIYWHTLNEWANLIYDYVNRNGLQNSVCTFYELTESNDCRKEEFFNLDKSILKKALNILNGQKKAEIIYLDENTDEGVKFF